jgi:hypothetical protein
VKNNIGTLILAKAKENGLIGVTGYYNILAISHQPTNEFMSPDNLYSNLDGS